MLVDQFITDWNGKLQASNKGKLYYLYKQEHKREDYLTILPKNLYIPLLKFRTANHRLPIEILRYNNTPYNERICEECRTLGDEFHAIMSCKRFTVIRKKYIPEYYYKHPNVIKYNELLNSTDYATLKSLSMFVSYILKQ